MEVREARAVARRSKVSIFCAGVRLPDSKARMGRKRAVLATAGISARFFIFRSNRRPSSLKASTRAYRGPCSSKNLASSADRRNRRCRSRRRMRARGYRLERTDSTSSSNERAESAARRRRCSSPSETPATERRPSGSSANMRERMGRNSRDESLKRCFFACRSMSFTAAGTA